MTTHQTDLSHPPPTDELRSKYACLNRGLRGVLIILLACLWFGFAYYPDETWVIEALVCVLYSVGPVIGLLASHLKPLRPENDPGCELLIRGATGGRWMSFWLGFGFLGAAIGCFLTTDRNWREPIVLQLAAGGLAWMLWSTQFPSVHYLRKQRVIPSNFRFPLRTLLIAMTVLAIYVPLTLHLSDPEQSVAWRLTAPVLAVGFLMVVVAAIITAVGTVFRGIQYAISAFGGRKHQNQTAKAPEAN